MIRVFPSRTNATPCDALAFSGKSAGVPMEEWRPPDQPVLISVAFTWDMRRGEELRKEWQQFYPVVQIGGPAYGSLGWDGFEPGLFLKPGYVITSRGCPNRCDFCFVPKREGGIRELPIKPGIDVLDNNLLACSAGHIEAVFEMLANQGRCVRFSGGFEAARVTPWIVSLLQSVRLPKAKAAIYLAYDHRGADKAVGAAIARLRAAGMCRRQIGCYVLIGRNGDTQDAAIGRLERVLELGALPFAMFYRDEKGEPPRCDWRKIRHTWIRQASIYAAHPGLD